MAAHVSDTALHPSTVLKSANVACLVCFVCLFYNITDSSPRNRGETDVAVGIPGTSDPCPPSAATDSPE